MKNKLNSFLVSRRDWLVDLEIERNRFGCNRIYNRRAAGRNAAYQSRWWQSRCDMANSSEIGLEMANQTRPSTQQSAIYQLTAIVSQHFSRILISLPIKITSTYITTSWLLAAHDMY